MTTGELFDLNQLPKSKGIIYFGISMSRISNAQSAQACFDYIEKLTKKINQTEGIGLCIIYSDHLYSISDDASKKVRDKNFTQMISHKNALRNLLLKANKYTISAFSFITMTQLLLDNSEQYISTYQKISDLYDSNEEFKNLVNEDCLAFNDNIEHNKVFILEEITWFYLANYMQMHINNTFIKHEEKWVLQCYPGQPLKSEIFLSKNNVLNFKSDNIYKLGMYNLTDSKYVDYLKINL